LWRGLIKHLRLKAPLVRLCVFSLGVIFVFASSSGCGTKISCGSKDGRAALVKAVDDLLNKDFCSESVALVENFYNKEGCGTDEIRFSRASAYLCAANLKFLDWITLFDGVSLATASFFTLLTQLFPSVTTDSRSEAARNAMDSLFAIRKIGVITPTAYLVGAGSTHPMSLVSADRTTDSNVYSLMTSMGQIGFLQNRYGAPNPVTFNKTQALGRTASNVNGWMLASQVDSNACTYAGSVLTMVDSMVTVVTDIGTNFGGSTFGSSMDVVSAAYQAAFGLACDAGCSGASGSGCTFPVGTCATCPITLRNPSSCTSQVTDVNSCAAAGLVWFINTQPGGWPGPL